MKTVAIVPIKLNNERLPNKNTLMLGNKPLLQYILNTLLSVTGICEIYIYCSDLAIKEYLPQGVNLLQRDTVLDLPTSNFTQIFDAFSNTIDADIYVYAHATAPFISQHTVENCLSCVLNGSHDSAFSAELLQEFLWKDGVPLNFNATNLPRTQDLPYIYKESSGIYVFKKDVFRKLRRRIGDNPYIHGVSGKEAIDINYPLDLKLAELYLMEDNNDG